MALLKLNIQGFRNLATTELVPNPDGFNCIYGINGSGKTSLLEAVYYLSRCRSFRTNKNNHIIQHNADRLLLCGQTSTARSIGVERGRQGALKIRIAEQDTSSLAPLLAELPVLIINTDSHDLIVGTPAERRRYLDWGSFYASTDFLTHWRTLQRILSQRNAALRQSAAPQVLAGWTTQLIAAAATVNQLRNLYAQQLMLELQRVLNDLALPGEFELQYYPGWGQYPNYAEALRQSQQQDQRQGYTQWGPQKADFIIKMNGLAAKECLSRGQQKLFACAMITAQGLLFSAHAKRRPIYLIDDLPAELDPTNQSRLMELLATQQAQVFITSIERQSFNNRVLTNPITMFHVEHGMVRNVDRL